MINGLYFIAFILSVINILLLAIVVKTQKSFYYVTLFMLISISCFGYLEIVNATSLEGALLGNVLSYMGAAFLPYCFLLSISDLCHVPIRNWIKSLLFLFSSSIFILVWMSLYGNRLYYSSVELQIENGISFLGTTDGPVHFLYEMSVLICTAATVLIMVKAFAAKKNLSYRNLNALTILELITVLFYLLEKLLELQVECMNLVYIFDEYILLVLIYRMGKYDVSESIAGSIEGLEEYGYMTFDNKLNYLGGSETLKKFFPDVTHVKVDCKVESNGYAFIEKAVQWLEHSVETGSREPLFVSVGGRELKCTLRTIHNGLFGRQSGYLVELFDDTKQQKYLNLLFHYNEQLEEEVKEKLNHIQKMQNQIVVGISDIVEIRDDNTGDHVKRSSEGVRILVEALKKEMEEFGMTEQFCENVIKAAPMHDLGKVAVEDQILRKPGKYTEEEYDQMKVHTDKGAEIVEKTLNGVEDEDFLNVARNIAHYHHEKWNGAGYPEGLSGIAIPLEARIMALADVFDALVSKRCYKDKLSYDEAFMIIENSLGTHFDPKIGKIFLGCRKELETYYNQFEQ